MDYKLVKPNQLPPEVQQLAQNMPKEEPKLDKNAIPDLENLLNQVIEFVQYINTDEMQKLEVTNNIAFEQHLDSKFEDFSTNYYNIFKLLLDRDKREENLCRLIDMFKELKRVKMGAIDIDYADKQYKEELNKEFIYPKYGGKQQFERAMQNKKK